MLSRASYSKPTPRPGGRSCAARRAGRVDVRQRSRGGAESPLMSQLPLPPSPQPPPQQPPRNPRPSAGFIAAMVISGLFVVGWVISAVDSDNATEPGSSASPSVPAWTSTMTVTAEPTLEQGGSRKELAAGNVAPSRSGVLPLSPSGWCTSNRRPSEQCQREPSPEPHDRDGRTRRHGGIPVQEGRERHCPFDRQAGGRNY